MSRIHISLPVTNLKESVKFYQGFLGHEPSKLRGDYANFRLDEPPIHLSLTPSVGPSESVGDRHYGVEVTGEDVLATWRQRMDTAGLIESTEEGTTCCYAVANKVWTKDPDGNSWEVWHRLADSEIKQKADAAACCG